LLRFLEHCGGTHVTFLDFHVLLFFLLFCVRGLFL
jgi:hypothetical protein